jgi:hypothetical protein
MTRLSEDNDRGLSANHPPASSAVDGAVRRILQAEGFAVFAIALVAYGHLGFSWRLFVLLFLAPDLSFFAYAAGPRAGAFAYNAVHSYVGAIVLAIVGYTFSNPFLDALALIWLAHIGLDRLLGYGLKYSSGFSDTHLGRIGKREV